MKQGGKDFLKINTLAYFSGAMGFGRGHLGRCNLGRMYIRSRLQSYGA